MKKIILIIFLCFCHLIVIKPTRIIQLSDIINWCIESDLILTANIIKLDTIYYDTIKSIRGNHYDICISGKEKYNIEIDTIIKGIYNLDTLNIYTPIYCIDHMTYIKEKNVITSLVPFDDNSWFRLKVGEERIILMKWNENIYEVLYSMDINKSNLDLIDSVKVRGKDYHMLIQKIEK